MSIWSSNAIIGWDDDPELPKQPVGGEVRAYASGWSNHYPLDGATREATAVISLASIAPWCVPGWLDDDSLDYPTCGPWLRLSLDSADAMTWWPNSDGERPTPDPIHADVVMDEAAVRRLVHELSAWLNHPKVQPKEVS